MENIYIITIKFILSTIIAGYENDGDEGTDLRNGETRDVQTSGQKSGHSNEMSDQPEMSS